MTLWPEIDPERLVTAQEQVDAASNEAVELAMAALHDRAIEQALWNRVQRELVEK